MIISSRAAPQVALNRKPNQEQSDEELRAELLAYGGTPREVVQDDDFMDLLLPVFRSDLRLLMTYTYRESSPLTCPLSVFYGTEDSSVSAPEAEAWAELTTSRFSVNSFRGDHFYWHGQLQQLRNAVCAELRL